MHGFLELLGVIFLALIAIAGITIVVLMIVGADREHEQIKRRNWGDNKDI